MVTNQLPSFGTIILRELGLLKNVVYTQMERF